MPHKRAKLSARQNQRATRGTDLPPTGSVSLVQENIPKSIARVLEAEAVRKAYRGKRGRHDTGQEVDTAEKLPKRRRNDTGEESKSLNIKHGESLTQYNRRIEEEMRIPVAEAMHTSRNSTRRARKADAEAAKAAASKLQPVPPKGEPTHHEITPTPPARKTDFDKKAITTRLNDIVQAPPNLTKLPRGVAKREVQAGTVTGKAEGVLSMAQKQMMEEEREQAIRRYRELKESRLTK